MSNEPFFPPPSERSKAAEPYRASASVRTSSPPSSRTRTSRPPPPADEVPRAKFIEAIVAEKKRRKRAPLIAVVAGIVLCLAGVALSFAASGRVIFYGLVVMGALAIVRGTMSFARIAMGTD